MTRKVLRRNRTPGSGSSSRGTRYEGGVCNGCEYIWGNGGNVLDPEDPTKVLVDSPQAIAGLATERAMITEGTSPEAVTVYQEDESAGAFLNGDAVFLRNWPYVYALVGTSDYPKLRTDQVGVSELPSADGRPGNGTVGDQPLYISASSKNPEAAWKFIEFLTAPEQQKFRAIEGSYLPTRTALYDDPEIQDSVPVVPLAKRSPPTHPPAPRLALLLGHVPGDAGAVQRLARRRHDLPRGGGTHPEGGARELHPAGSGILALNTTRGGCECGSAS